MAALDVPALAARFAELREDAVRLIDAMRGDDAPAARSVTASLREFLRQTSGPNDRLQTMAAATPVAAPVEPLVPRHPQAGANGLPPGRPHP